MKEDLPIKILKVNISESIEIKIRYYRKITE